VIIAKPWGTARVNTGVFTPVLAKHSKSFSLVDCLSVCVDRKQPNFEPTRNHPEIDVRYPPGMSRTGQKRTSVLAILVAVITMAAPDSCVADLGPNSAPTLGISASARTTGDEPFGCTLEEDCFCCAHIAPVRNFVLPAIVALAHAEALPNHEQPFERVASLTFSSYQPPGVSTAFRS
jgi:hypothetical protein